MSRSIINRDSVERLYVPLTPPPGVTLAAQPLAIACVPRGVQPLSSDFKSATLSGTSATMLVGPGTTLVFTVAALYVVWVKITATPEVPIIAAGTLTVT